MNGQYATLTVVPAALGPAVFQGDPLYALELRRSGPRSVPGGLGREDAKFGDVPPDGRKKRNTSIIAETPEQQRSNASRAARKRSPAVHVANLKESARLSLLNAKKGGLILSGRKILCNHQTVQVWVADTPTGSAMLGKGRRGFTTAAGQGRHPIRNSCSHHLNYSFRHTSIWGSHVPISRVPGYLKPHEQI